MAERESSRGGRLLFDGRSLREALPGALVSGPWELAEVESVCIDSRKAAPLALFVCLPGERTDGHDHAAAACASGASVVVARHSERAKLEGLLAAAGAKPAILFVEDCLAALQALAAVHVSRYPRLRRIGVTGSSGKTTTKEMIASVLARAGRVAMNQGNLNSDSGLPLSVFAIDEGHDYGVFEMGMNRKGEIAELAAVLRPQAAVVTNVGSAHVGILGSREAIAAEKKMAFSRFTGSEVAFVPEEDDFRAFLAEGVNGKVVEFGRKGTRGFRGGKSLGLDGTAVDWEGLQIRLPLPGPHNLSNALAAVSVAVELGIPAAAVKEGLEAVKPLFGRAEVLRGGGATCILDCYNANPESMEASIGFADSVDWAGRRVYVLGSMLELGMGSRAAHEAVGTMVAASRADLVCFFGAEAKAAWDAAKAAGAGARAFWTDDYAELEGWAARAVRKGDLVLLKGSRGMALERLAPAIAAAGGA